MGNLFSVVTEEQSRETLRYAFDHDLSYVDTAPHYGAGLSELRVGGLIREVGRERLVLSTKVGRRLHAGAQSTTQEGFVDALPFTREFDYSFDGVMRSIDSSMARLGTDHFDLVFLHDLGELTHGTDAERYLRQALDGGVKALETLKSQGVIGAYGLGVNETKIVSQFIEHASLDVVLLAGRYSLLEQQEALPLFAQLAPRNVRIVAGGIYNSGILAKGSRALDAHYNYGSVPEPILQKVQRLEAVCEAHGVSLQAAATQFCGLNPIVCSVLLGARSAEQLKTSLAWSKEPIDTEFWKALIEQGLIEAEGLEIND
ncbi:MAG: aldo/keto reductase [Gammaproteobacteria bacterium]|nr:aldo/keto reductase [Gammaproteobacteria bacterium]